MTDKNTPAENHLNDESYVADILNSSHDDSISFEDNTDDILFGDDKKRKRKNTVLLSSAIALALTVGGTIVFWEPVSTTLGFNTEHEQREGEKLTQDKNNDDEDYANIPIEGELDGESEAFALKSGNEFPVDTEEWQITPYSTLGDDNLSEEYSAYADDVSLSIEANILPQEAAGFTSDASQELLDDGTLNPMYSYWTSEVFQHDMTEILNRLLNPVYGEWGLYQFGEYKPNSQFDMSIIEDMFTESWIKENSGKPYSEYVPVYADWNENNYGLDGEILVSGNRWIGDVKNITSDFTYDQELQQYIVDMTVDVKFSAWSIDEETLERTGTLELTLVPNNDGANSNSDYRVLVNKANLTVDGA